MNEKKIEDLANEIGKKITLSEGILDPDFLDDVTKAEHVLRVLIDDYDSLPENVRSEILEITEK